MNPTGLAVVDYLLMRESGISTQTVYFVAIPLERGSGGSVGAGLNSLSGIGREIDVCG